MTLQTGGLLKSGLALVTFKRLLAAVCSEVSFQVGGVRKRLGTVLALEGFLPAVDPLMDPQVG